MPRCLTYIRVSSKEQAAGDRYSLPEQDRRLREHAGQRGYTVVGAHQDVESGRRDDRASYQQMLTRLRRGEADVVLVRWLDRFGRNPREILSRIWELEDLGIRVEASDEDLSHELIRLIRAWQTGEESRKIRDRVIPTMRARAQEGKWSGAIPFGYAYSKDGKPVPLSDERYRSVDLAFAWYDPECQERLSIRELARRLTAEGYRSPWGRAWSPTIVHNILVNPIYCGDLSAHGVLIRDNHEARVSRAQWERVQARLRSRRRNCTSWQERPEVLAAGLLYCGVCGSRMGHTFTRGNSAVSMYGYWGCPRRWLQHDCPQLGVSDMALAQILRERLRAIVLPPTDELMGEAERQARTALGADDATARLRRLEDEIARLRRTEDNLIDMRARDEINRRQFGERIDPVRQQLVEIEGKLRCARTESGLADLPAMLTQLREIVELLRTSELHDPVLRVLVGMMVERMTIGADRGVTIRWRPGAALLLSTQ